MPTKLELVTNLWGANVPTWALGYIAGIIDGEGSIVANYHSYGSSARSPAAKLAVFVSISNTDKRMLLFIQKHFDCRIFNKHRDAKMTKPAWTIQLGGHQAIHRFLVPLLPFLVTKRGQALLAIDFIQTFTSQTWKGRKASTMLRQDNPLVRRRIKLWHGLRGLNNPSPTRKKPDFLTEIVGGEEFLASLPS